MLALIDSVASLVGGSAFAIFAVVATSATSEAGGGGMFACSATFVSAILTQLTGMVVTAEIAVIRYLEYNL